MAGKYSKHSLQIDVIGGVENMIECYIYVDGKAHKAYIHRNSYNELVRDGFFIRSGDERDSAGVLNTTTEFKN